MTQQQVKQELLARIRSLIKTTGNRKDFWGKQYLSFIRTNPTWQQDDFNLKFYTAIMKQLEKGNYS